MSNKEHRNALPVGHELHWYRIESVLGQGGFGLTYLARDINLERMVAIKEYMPTQISMRESDMVIHPLSKEAEADYQWGLDRFLSEARILTRFEHPSLVRVFNVFEANNSAYMVMNYEQGKSLRDILKKGYTFSEDELVKLMFTLMDGLEIVHNEGFVHRDIKPGNIFIRADGQPVLLDFGSARQTRGTFTTKTLTNFVSPGYAPIEQYAGKSDRQGPWTDIYGLGATAYQALTGNMPEASIDRSVMISNEAGDNLIHASLLCKDRYSDTLLAAIDHALAFNIEDRPQTIAEWRKEFGIGETTLEKLKLPIPGPDTIAVTTVTEKLDPQTQKLEAKTFRSEDTEAPKPVTATEKLATSLSDPVLSRTIAPASAHSRYRSFMLVMAASGILAVSLIGYHTNWRMTENNSTELVVQELALDEAAPDLEMVTETGSELAMVVESEIVSELETETQTVTEPELGPIVEVPAAAFETITVVPELTVEQKITELLRLAGEDIAALRLTTPRGNNAYDKYLSVLALDQGNLDAVTGIDNITDRYLQLVDVDIEDNNLERAGQYLEKADYLRPDQPKVVAARERLNNAIYERDRPRSVFGKIKNIFR